MARTIENYPDYSVDESGVVYGPKGALKPNRNSRGYYQVSLVKWAGIKRTVCSKSVHRLVAETYIPNPLNKPTVNHKDSDKGNNSVENLEWNTHQENLLHSAAVGTHPTGADHYRFKDGKQGAWRRERRAQINQQYQKEKV